MGGPISIRARESGLEPWARELSRRLRGRETGPFRLELTARVVRAAFGVPVLAVADRGAGSARLTVPLDEGENAAAAPVDDRFEKLALHELGHLEGFEHCDTPGCVMHHVARASDLDALSPDRCESCRR